MITSRLSAGISVPAADTAEEIRVDRLEQVVELGAVAAAVVRVLVAIDERWFVLELDARSRCREY
jgi:hypothetical protein